MFFSVFGLFFIFDNINQIAKKCKTNQIDAAVCESFTGFGVNMIIVLLIIAGFTLVISSTFFILIR